MGTLLRIISWPYRVAVRNVIITIENIKENTVLGKILNSMSLVPTGGSVILFLVSLIVFIFTNGFGRQVSILKTHGLWDSVSSSSGEAVWTSGTAGYFYNVWLLGIVGVIFLALTVSAVIGIYRNASKGRKIALSIFTFLLAASGTVFGLSFTTVLQGNAYLQNISFGVCAVSLIAFIVILSWNEYFKSSLISSATFLATAPLTVLVIENIIGLVAFAIALIIMLVVGLFFGSALTSSSPESSAPATAKPDPAAEKELKKKQGRMTQLQNEIKNLDDSIEGHAEKRLGYFGVDPKYCSRKRAEKKKELEQLMTQM